MSLDANTPAPATARDENLRGLIAATGATGAAVADDPDKALARFRASGRGGEGVRTHIRVGRHSVLVDEPPALGGSDDAPNPVENALVALLSCQVVTYRFWAVQLGVPLDDIDVEVEGDLDVRGFFGLDDGVRPGFGEVRVAVRLSGPAEPERYRELQEAVDAHCPVLDLFRAQTPVSTRLVTD